MVGLIDAYFKVIEDLTEKRRFDLLVPLNAEIRKLREAMYEDLKNG